MRRSTLARSTLARAAAWWSAAWWAAASCAAAPPGAPAMSTPMPAPTPAQLAALAFPGWSAGSAHVQNVRLTPSPGLTHGSYVGWSAGDNRVLVDPQLALRLDASHLTLIAGLVPAAADGKPAAAHATPMALAAYQFELRGGAWTLARRQGVFALRGFFGAATLRAVNLSSQHQALAVEYGSCWQGYCGTWLAVYEADNESMKSEPAVELALSGHNVDSTGDCLRRLQPLVKAHPQDLAARDDGGAPDSHDCYAIEGGWSVEAARDTPGDLVLHYQGAMSRAEAHAAPPLAVDQRQVLRYDAGKYRAVSGFDPVPPI